MGVRGSPTGVFASRSNTSDGISTPFNPALAKKAGISSFFKGHQRGAKSAENRVEAKRILKAASSINQYKKLLHEKHA
jgi:hypothetical protein